MANRPWKVSSSPRASSDLAVSTVLEKPSPTASSIDAFVFKPVASRMGTKIRLLSNRWMEPTPNTSVRSRLPSRKCRPMVKSKSTTPKSPLKPSILGVHAPLPRPLTGTEAPQSVDAIVENGTKLRQQQDYDSGFCVATEKFLALMARQTIRHTSRTRLHPPWQPAAPRQ